LVLLNEFKVFGKEPIHLLVNLIKIGIIVFLAFSLLGNINPFYEGKDAYIHGIASINLSKGDIERENPLLKETGRNELVGDRWLLTDFNSALPRLPGIGIAIFGAISYIVGGYYGLFYLTPIFTVILLIVSERVATSLFGRYVGLFTLAFLACSNLLFRNSINLQTESIFSVFFVLGCFYLIKYLKNKNELHVLLASILFAFSSVIRLQGLATFPIEIIIVAGYFIIKNVQKKNFQKNSKNFISNQVTKKQIIKISFFVLIPWIVFFILYMGYNDYYFGDPLTNYVDIAQIKSYETSVSSIFIVEVEDIENVKQYSKYLLPYQITAVYNKTTNNFDNFLGENWIGALAIIFLIIGVLVSIRTKNHRLEIVSFLFFSLSTVWFYSSITTAERAASGVPGRYMIPVFILSLMIFGFLLNEFLKWCPKQKKIIFNRSFKIVKSGVLIGVILFLISGFYFSSPIQIILKDGLSFKDPSNLAERYPLSMEGLSSNSVIFSVRTDAAVEYGVISFTPNPKRTQESFDLLHEILEKKYEVFTFKHTSWDDEKIMIKQLTKDLDISLVDYSQTFCKLILKEKQESQRLDSVCLQ